MPEQTERQPPSHRALTAVAVGLAVILGLVVLLRLGSGGGVGRRFVQTASPGQVTAPGREPLAPPEREVSVGETAPDLVLPDLQGQLVSLRTFRGRRVALNIWASWCPPCINEMPSLEALHRARGQDVVVLAACVDEDLPAARAIVARMGLTMPVLLDPGGQRLARWGTVRYPETWLIDERGVVTKRVIGAVDWTSPAALAPAPLPR